MKVIISPEAQLKFKPIEPSIASELTEREGNKDYVYNLTPFVRVSCLQEVSYTDERLDGKSDNLKEIKDSVLVDNTKFDGFQFIFNSDFEESYGEVQKIGNTLDSKDVRIKNPRRVPPPVLNSFTATVGEGSDYFTTAQLSFTCNSLEQLQFLVPFLFNPGNTIFVEFGHNTEKLKNQISFFDSDDADKLVQSTVIDFDSNSTCGEGFIERMNKRIFQSGGAYDFFYGIINNFDFSVNDSLGYDCTVDLIAASKMKLKAPNTDDNSNRNDSVGRTVLTLESKLKRYIDMLYLENTKTERDMIIQFSDGISELYVRFDSILAFLDGKFNWKAESRLNDGFYVARQSSTRVDSEIPDKINGVQRGYDTILSDGDLFEVRKADVENGEPPIVSYSDDLLLFRKKMWNPYIAYDNDTGTYLIDIDEDNPLNDYVNGNEFLGNYKFNITDIPPDTEERSPNQTFEAPELDGVTLMETKFNTIKPYLMDIPGVNDRENLNHAYINFQTFRSIYLASDGKALDVLKKLQDLINDATNDQWEIQFVGDSIKPRGDSTADSSTNRCEKTVSRFISVSSFDLEKGDTYTFKANSKGSVFTSMDYGLGLDGLLGDQIYMNALNSTNGSMDSKKLNLLLFSNHENNLEITDKRNSRISELRKDEPNSSKDAVKSNNEESEINEVSVVDLKQSFGGRDVVANTGVAEVPALTAVPTAQSNARKLYDSLFMGAGLSQDPAQVKLRDLNKLIVQYINVDGESIPRFSVNEIIDGVFGLYDIERIPLVFSQVKGSIENIRATKDDFVQPKGEKKSQAQQNQQRRQRSFKKGGVNPLLESTLDVSLPGIGGINPLEYVKVSGIPDVYAKRGEFCVMNVTHTVTPNDWTTQLSTRFRPTYEDE